MRRKIVLSVFATGLAAILLAVAGLLAPKGPSAAQAVSIYIESLTNLPGTSVIAPQRMAWMVITNHSSSTFRLLGWSTFVGPRPPTSPKRRSLDNDFSLLPPWSSRRVMISAPTNAQLWSGTACLTRDALPYRIGWNILSSRHDFVKGTASVLMPRISVEDLYTSPRID
jgi:hypothetical protein